jgi:hypothetical protein
MSDTIPVEPSVVTEVKTITNFRATIQDLQLFTSVSLRVELLGEEGNLISIQYVILSGDDYAGWNNDDNYIVNKVAEKLGLVRKPSDV